MTQHKFGTWYPIETLNTHFPVLVSIPKSDKECYIPTTAFFDVTAVWRVYRSKSGMTKLPFKPTHWMPLPPPPKENE